MQQQTSHLIRDTAKKTGMSYKELEAIWRTSTQELESDIMSNPSAYKFFSKSNGDYANAINGIFQKKVINPTQSDAEESIDTSNEIAENEFASDMTASIAMPDDELATNVEPNPETEEEDFGDFDILGDGDDFFLDETDDTTDLEEEKAPE